MKIIDEKYVDWDNDNECWYFTNENAFEKAETVAFHDKQLLNRLSEMLVNRAELIDDGYCAEFMFTVYDLQESIKEILGE